MAKTQAGIVGLPNVGKSTLFNALTRSRKAEAANYPFCTIEPNVGVVLVPDDRMLRLQEIAGTKVVIPATIDIVDIAGLVAGASKGEGKGNDFLSNIRECDAIIHVVRCFDNDDIVHSMGKVDPVRDIGVIETELILADLQSAEQQMERNQKKVRSQDKEAIANVELLGRLVKHLNENLPASVTPREARNSLASAGERSQSSASTCAQITTCSHPRRWPMSAATAATWRFCEGSARSPSATLQANRTFLAESRL